MRHLTEGELRRYYDDPDAIVATERSHFASCTVCQDRFHGVAADAKRVRTLLDTTPAPVDARVALSRFHSNREKAGRRPAPSVPAPAGIALAGTCHRCCAGCGGHRDVHGDALRGFAARPLRAYHCDAGDPESQSDLQSLAPLSHLWDHEHAREGDRNPRPSQPTRRRQATGLAPLHDQDAPSSVAGEPTSYETVSQGTTSFTFDAAKAAAAAQQAGQTAPSFPAGVDGSSLVVQTGPGEAVLYGNEQQIRQALQQANGSGSAAYQQAAEAAGTFMVAGEMRAPTISSTGASVDQIKQTLLKQPTLDPGRRR